MISSIYKNEMAKYSFRETVYKVVTYADCFVS